jgi:hypothetical protein
MPALPRRCRLTMRSRHACGRSPAACPEALDRAGREAPKPGEVKIDVPPAMPANRLVDLEALARQFNGGRPAVQKTGSDLMVFVSLSMPEHVIKALARQAKEAGAVMVLRGLKGGSWQETWKSAGCPEPGHRGGMDHPSRGLQAVQGRQGAQHRVGGWAHGLRHGRWVCRDRFLCGAGGRCLHRAGAGHHEDAWRTCNQPVGGGPPGRLRRVP